MKAMKRKVAVAVLGLLMASSSLAGTTFAKGLPVVTAPTEREFTLMPQELTSRSGKFMVTIPWQVDGLTYIDKTVPTSGGHMVGYGITLTDDDGEEARISITRRDNVPNQGISQKVWNTTWYDVPVEHMTKDEYLSIWQKNNPDMWKSFHVDGDLFDQVGVTSARWDRLIPNVGTIITDTDDEESDAAAIASSRAIFDGEIIYEGDPKHRYLVTAAYPLSMQDEIESGIVNTIIPSLIHVKPSKLPKPDVVLGSTSITVPKGLKLSSAPKREGEAQYYTYTKGDSTYQITRVPISLSGVLFTDNHVSIRDRYHLAKLYREQIEKEYKLTLSDPKTIVHGSLPIVVASYESNHRDSPTATMIDTDHKKGTTDHKKDTFDASIMSAADKQEALDTSVMHAADSTNQSVPSIYVWSTIDKDGYALFGKYTTKGTLPALADVVKVHTLDPAANSDYTSL